MKKKFIAFALACAVALTGFTGLTPAETVKAETAAPTIGSSIDKPVEAAFSKNYQVNWSSVGGRVYNHLKVAKDGVIKVNCDDVFSSYDNLINMNVTLYNSKKESFLYVRDEDGITGLDISFPVAAGEYYICISPAAIGGCTPNSTYSFDFTETNDYEKEDNGEYLKANPIITGKKYYGYLGGGFSNLSPIRDRNDFYKVSLKKDHVYRYRTNASDDRGRTTLSKLYSSTSAKTHQLTYEYDDVDRFAKRPNRIFVAPYTGDYYLHFGNYNNDQYKYEFIVEELKFNWSPNRQSCTVTYFDAAGKGTTYPCTVTVSSVTKAGTRTNGSVTYKAVSSLYPEDVAYEKVILAPLASAKVSAKAFSYNGKTQKPKVTVKGTDGSIIDPVYYDVVYAKKSKNIGIYSVTVQMKDTYYSTFVKPITLQYEITPAKEMIKKTATGKKSLKVTWKKDSNASGYEVQYSTNKSFKKDKKTLNVKKNKTVSAKISKLKSKKYYYVRVRSYKKVGSQKVYGSWSTVKKLKVK